MPESRGCAPGRITTYDSLVAIGGGSSIDTAKGMSVLYANGGRMRDYKVPNEIPLAGPPVIAIPTTAGTGSEVTRFTVITDTETDEKMLIAGLACCPAAAIVDYELTLTMPLRLTADTGIDSLTHAIEAYVSRRANPFADGLAKNAMGLIARNIRTACAEPDNRAAREAMMLGATTAGMAFSNASVALVHGMSRPIGAFFHVPHGLSNAMLLPEITAFSAPAALDRYADCARAMGVADESEGSQAAVARLVDELRRLNAICRCRARANTASTGRATRNCCRSWRARRSPRARRPTTRACRARRRSSSCTGVCTSRSLRRTTEIAASFATFTVYDA